MEYLFIAKRVEENLEALKLRDRQLGAVAEKADRILASIRSGNLLKHDNVTGKCTKYGEKRIKSCRKYDLGSGYRMITIHRGTRIFITFLGTHDECQRWLARNSKIKEVSSIDATQVEIASENQQAEYQAKNGLSFNDCSEHEDFIPELTDQELRAVFCGLVEGAKK